MQATSIQYRDAITGSSRFIIPRVVADFSDPDVVYGAVTSSGIFPYTNPDQLTARETELDGHFFTMEPHRFLLDGRGKFFEGFPPAVHLGFTINPLSNNQGIFTTPQFAQRTFTDYHVLQVVSVNFSKNTLDGIGVDFRLDIYSGAGIIYSRDITDNTEEEVIFTGFTAYEPTAVRVTFTRWSLPFRRVRIASVILGVYEQWTGRELAKLDIMQQTDMSNMAVPYGVATVEVYNEGKRFNPFQRAGVFESIAERQRLDLELAVELPDGSMEWLPAGSYYMQNGGWQSNAYEQTWFFRMADIVGLLATRPFIMPSPAPNTLKGWVAACVAHLGINFIDRYQVDVGIANTPITGNPVDVSCGDILRYACMIVGAYFRADAATGDLRISTLPAGGSAPTAEITLDNQHDYPNNKARDDIASLTFELTTGARHTFIGTNISTEEGRNIKNPFIHTLTVAEQAARNILIHFGGTEFEVKGRGDLAAELGDVERLATGFDTTITARRYKQQFRIGNEGVLDNAPSWLYLSTGIELYEGRVVLIGSGTFTVPAGVTSLRLIIVQGGDGGTNGTDGAWSRPGEPGQGGLGGRVYLITFNVNPGATFNYSAGLGGIAGGGLGQHSTFGNYSSASGIRLDAGYTDVYGGGVYGMSGYDAGIGEGSGRPGADETGQGGGGGDAGWQGERRYDDEAGETKVIRQPGKGRPGARGGRGCIVLYYKKEGL